MNVTPGVTYNLTVGVGGSVGTSTADGGSGGSSYFGNASPGGSSGAPVLAVGGAGGVHSAGGSASGVTGSTSGNVPAAGTAGATMFAGTDGSASATGASGAGGSGAGAAGSLAGGAGGASVTTANNNGNSGAVPGGGGSGSLSSSTSKIGGAGGSGRIQLTFSAPTPTAADSTAAAAAATVSADGTSSTMITVTIKDAGGRVFSGRPVTLAQTSGSGATITPVQGVTDDSGVATFTVKSSTPGSAAFAATDPLDGITIKQTAEVNFEATSSTSAISGSSAVAIGQAGKVYSVTLTDGSSYAWTVPSGASITAGGTGPNNNQITVTFGSVGGDITVTETTSAGSVGSPVTKSVTVGPNHAPTVSGCSKTCTKGLSVKIQVAGSGALASDADGDSLAIANTAPAHGSATVVGDYIVYQNDGTGTSDSFDYTVDDGQGGTATATVAITVADPSGLSQNNLAPPVDIDGGQKRVRFLGIPGSHYELQSTTSLSEPCIWTTVPGTTTQTADVTGLVQFDFIAPGSTSYFRTHCAP